MLCFQKSNLWKLETIPIATIVFDTSSMRINEKNQAFLEMFGELESIEDVWSDRSDITKMLHILRSLRFYKGEVNCNTLEPIDPLISISMSIMKSPSMDTVIDIPNINGDDFLKTRKWSVCEVTAMMLDNKKASCCFCSLEQSRLFEYSLYKLLYYHHKIIKSMYPKHITDVLTTMKHGLNQINNTVSLYHKNVTVCFADIVDFTQTCSNIQPKLIMEFLNDYFSCLDKDLSKFNVYRYETIGDCYVCVSGLGTYNKKNQFECITECDPFQSVCDMMDFAKSIVNVIANKCLGTKKMSVRIGMHTGNVTSGIIENAMPKYSLFGDTMNVASRMEGCSKPNYINVSPSTYMYIRDNREAFKCQELQVKGKGMMKTWLLDMNHFSSPIQKPSVASSNTSCLSELLVLANKTIEIIENRKSEETSKKNSLDNTHA